MSAFSKTLIEELLTLTQDRKVVMGFVNYCKCFHNDRMVMNKFLDVVAENVDFSKTTWQIKKILI